MSAKTTAATAAQPAAQAATPTVGAAPMNVEVSENTNAIVEARIRELRSRSNSAYGKVKIASVNLTDEGVTEDDQGRLNSKYIMRFAGMQGSAYVYNAQLDYLVPFALDTNNVRATSAMLKQAQFAEVLRVEYKAGEEMYFNIHSTKDVADIANKDITVLYVLGLQFTQRFLEKIEDATIAKYV